MVEKNKVERSTTKVVEKVSEIKQLPMPEFNEFYDRVVTTGKNYAYLKIGEGCSNMCTYCAIPYIRGKFISRKMKEILDEAEMLAKKGIKELIVIAQDTTKYGVDIYGEPKLAELLQKLSDIDGIKWIRFLYSYPEGITDELIEVVKNNEKICKYFDIPIQHISNKVLKRMNRKTNKEQIESIISNIRNKIPNVVLRTSLIVGFPGETDDDFRELEEFVEKTKFDKLGTFMYSKEEGTPAARLPEQIHGNTKKSRYNKIMSIQQKVSNENLKNKIGKNVEVLIEDISFDGKYLDTAEFFILQRGTKPYYFDKERGYRRENGSIDYTYNQAHIPPIEQSEAVGHAVRGVYLYSGMADVAKETENDKLLSACEKIWKDIEERKMYITGGIGSTVDGEAFSFEYDLPNDLAYNETCASIGLIFFAKRMLEIKPNSKYANVIERALYNTVLHSMSEDGKSFFYVNALEVLPKASHQDSRKYHIKPTRQKWFGCACCPPNLARLLSSLGDYCFSENDENIYVHQYIGGEIKSDKAEIKINSNYIKNGKIDFNIKDCKPFKLALRIPDWCDNFELNRDYNIIDGYAYIDVNESTSVSISFNIEPKIIKCSNSVRENIGKAAVTRGAIVYCTEEADNGKNLQLLSISKNSKMKVNSDLTITASGYREKEDEKLYFNYKESTYEKENITFIPYYKSCNRGENEMSVYIRIKE